MSGITRRTFTASVALFAAVQLLPASKQAGASGQTADIAITPAEARVIAKEAYIYGFPMVDSYRIQHAYFVDKTNPEYKAPWNTLVNTPARLHAG